MEKFLDGSIDNNLYKTYQADLDVKEAQCRAELEAINEALSKIFDRINVALKSVKNCYKTYKYAEYGHKLLLANTIFEKVIIKDRKITEALLRHPFVYLCKDKVSKRDEFLSQYQGGDGGEFASLVLLALSKPSVLNPSRYAGLIPTRGNRSRFPDPLRLLIPSVHQDTNIKLPRKAVLYLIVETEGNEPSCREKS